MKCDLCGLELPATSEAQYHEPCRKARHKLRSRIRARHGEEYNEVAATVICLVDDAEWLLEQPSKEVKKVFGERGQDIVLDAAIKLSQIRGYICRTSSRG